MGGLCGEGRSLGREVSLCPSLLEGPLRSLCKVSVEV